MPEMKCDIEINITSEDDNYDAIEIPACLRESTLQSLTNSVKENGVVRLPERYANKLKRNADVADSNGHFVGDICSVGNDLVTREKDLSTALKWIKQEIVS